MYVAKNIYQQNVVYVDMPDKDIIHEAINKAKLEYEINDGLSSDTLDVQRLKTNSSPVFFATTVSKKVADDDRLTRREMNDRARRKYLVLDVDYNAGEDEKSKDMRKRLIKLADDNKTYLIIYPTLSYPEKPRFRAYFFIKRSVNEASYLQAMNWLYDKLGESPTDNADLSAKSNNNAPLFINDEQVEAVYDTSQDDDLTPLDNSIWKTYPKPVIKKKKTVMKVSKIDAIKLSDSTIKKAAENYAESDNAKDYNAFWMFVYSVARAVYTEQISLEQGMDIMEISANAAPNEETKNKWLVENRQILTSYIDRIKTGQSSLEKAFPLLKVHEFQEAYINNDDDTL